MYTTTLTAAHIRALKNIFGENAAFDAPSLRVYASDASLKVGQPLAMVRPTCVEQVQAFMRFAADENIAVHPRGRGTSLAGGCVPTVPGVVISMLGMDRIISISDTDFVAVVEAGVNTALFQAECTRRGLFYPPDPASAKATSLGGNVITCAGGLRAVKYGVTRDYVLGMEVVLPGGDTLRLGGRAHKDVVGLDLTRVFVGSEGTLGVVTQLTLKLLPRPEASASVLAGYASLDAALGAVQRVFAAGLLPCAVEFMNETVLDILGQTGACPWPATVQSLMLFQVDGSAAAVPLDCERLAASLGIPNTKNTADGVLWSLIATDKASEDALWAHRRRVSTASYVLGPNRIGGDMAVPRGSIVTAVRRFEAIAAAHGKRLIAFGHAGDGNIHANLHYDASDPHDSARTLSAHHALDAAALALGGSLSGEHGAGCTKDVSQQIGPREREVMRCVRACFDPKGILNPNKAY